MRTDLVLEGRERVKRRSRELLHLSRLRSVVCHCSAAVCAEQRSAHQIVVDLPLQPLSQLSAEDFGGRQQSGFDNCYDC